MDDKHKNMYKMKPGDVFAYTPYYGVKHMIYSFIEAEYDKRNWIIVQITYNGNILRNKISKGTQLYIPAQDNIEENFHIMVYRCFADGRYIDYLK